MTVLWDRKAVVADSTIGSIPWSYTDLLPSTVACSALRCPVPGSNRRIRSYRKPRTSQDRTTGIDVCFSTRFRVWFIENSTRKKNSAEDNIER